MSVALLLFVVTIVLSGSRGALAAAFLGAVVVSGSPSRVRRRLLRTAVVTAVFVLAVGATRLPQPQQLEGSGSQGGGGVATGGGGTPPSELPGGRLSEDVGRPTTLSNRRGLLGSSGRVPAWRAALEQANERPLLGYGFGTEDIVFVDRVYSFQGRRPENSVLGAYLQVGLVGLGLLLAVFGSALVGGLRGVGRLPPVPRRVALTATGVVVAGAVMSLVQSYVYAAGNLAALTVWSALLILGIAVPSWREEPK